MIGLVVEHIIPAALSLLPAAMRSAEASAMLTAVGLQEGELTERHQRPDGPALGLWQFERSGLRAVLSHPSTKPHADAVIKALHYEQRAFVTLHQALEHNDIFAAAIARLLLWSDPAPMPGPEARDEAWSIYLRTWCPGRPRPERWTIRYDLAWARVRQASTPPAMARRKEFTDAARFDRRANA